mgnify:CR=1 FL=1
MRRPPLPSGIAAPARGPGPPHEPEVRVREQALVLVGQLRQERTCSWRALGANAD